MPPSLGCPLLLSYAAAACHLGTLVLVLGWAGPLISSGAARSSATSELQSELQSVSSTSEL